MGANYPRSARETANNKHAPRRMLPSYNYYQINCIRRGK